MTKNNKTFKVAAVQTSPVFLNKKTTIEKACELITKAANNANSLYFTIGLLAYNLLQLLKQIGLPEEYHNKSIKTIRYQLIKLAGKVITHARYRILQIAAPLKNIELYSGAYYRIRYAPL